MDPLRVGSNTLACETHPFLFFITRVLSSLPPPPHPPRLDFISKVSRISRKIPSLSCDSVKHPDMLQPQMLERLLRNPGKVTGLERRQQRPFHWRLLGSRTHTHTHSRKREQKREWLVSNDIVSRRLIPSLIFHRPLAMSPTGSFPSLCDSVNWLEKLVHTEVGLCACELTSSV